MELHNRISGRSFNSKVVQALADIVEIVCANIFITVDHVVKGGSVGKGTAFAGCNDAEVVFFLKGRPPTRHDVWLPPLLKSVAGILSEHISPRQHSESIQVVDESVHLRMKDLAVDLRFSPTFATYSETIETLSEQGPDFGRFYAASLAKERVQFISRQPGQVKVTMRLLKWWRDQQLWSSKFSCPPDEVLELMAVYSAIQTKPKDQRMAIANVMSLLSRFNELRIVWSNYYKKEDVWAPLLRQRPLLMDPTNPFVNVADPQAFDASDLMELARTTHFFW
jgi:2'-5'-oligoadenylate synthetase/2'-5'-oligoadenylate synthase-like protein